MLVATVLAATVVEATCTSSELVRRVKPQRIKSDACLTEQMSVPGHVVVGPTTVLVDHIQDVYEQLINLPLKPSYSGMLNLSKTDGPSKRCSRVVPKIIHFIWLGSPISETHARNLFNFGIKNPKWKIMLWVDRSLNQASASTKSLLSSTSFRPAGGIIPKSIQAHRSIFRNWDIINGIRNKGFQSDYLRLEVVYLHGGIYLDIDAVPIHGFDDYGTLFRWPWVTHSLTSYKNIMNGAFGMDKNSGFLDFALNASRENCLKYKMWDNGLLTIGPAFFTTAFKRYNQSDISLIAQEYVLFNHSSNSIMYQTFEASWNKTDE